jgi:hypothetical protein
MTDWVRAQCRDWGRWHREQERASGYPASSMMARILEGGSLSGGITAHSQRVPVKFMPRDVLTVHRAWLELPESERMALWLRYVPPGRLEDRIETLDVDRATFFRWMDRAHARLSQAMLMQSSRSQKSHF